MSTPMSTSGHHSHHSIRGAAWVLGITADEICRDIRTGAIRGKRRRSRLVIPDREVARLLGERSTSLPEERHDDG